MVKSMREVADELGISKDLVKYHRKKLGEDDYVFARGQYLILESGVAKIKSYLTKEKGKYSTQFEHKVLDRLLEIETRLLLLSRILGNVEDKLDRLDAIERKLSNIDEDIAGLFDVVVGIGI